jgi:hypothetical protein
VGLVKISDSIPEIGSQGEPDGLHGIRRVLCRSLGQRPLPQRGHRTPVWPRL